MLLGKLYGTMMVGAVFFKWVDPEHLDLTWVDAMYFSMVLATSVGYGDIVPDG